MVYTFFIKIQTQIKYILFKYCIFIKVLNSILSYLSTTFVLVEQAETSDGFYYICLFIHYNNGSSAQTRLSLDKWVKVHQDFFAFSNKQMQKIQTKILFLFFLI